MKIKFINKSLLLERSMPSSSKLEGEGKKVEKILVISDIHIGYEEALEKQGIFLPQHQFEEIMGDIKKIFQEIRKVNQIVILGDLKHEFGDISSQEWRETLAFLDFLKENSKKIILIRGNHDNILGPIAKMRNLEVKDYYKKNGICFVHGNRLITDSLDKDVKIIIAGHRHPAIMLSKGAKRETYKCFLKGKWKGKELVILPSFLPLIEGTDIIKEDYEIALKINFKNFEVYIIGDKVYDFGKLKDVGKLR